MYVFGLLTSTASYGLGDVQSIFCDSVMNTLNHFALVFTNKDWKLQIPIIFILGLCQTLKTYEPDLKPDPVPIESGTTYTFLPQTAYNSVKEALRSTINLPQADGSSVHLDLCFSQQGSSNTTFPTMTFHFDGEDYNLPTDNYLLAVNTDIICLAMLPVTGIAHLVFS